MKKNIWKFEIKYGSVHEIPKGSEILDCQLQRGKIMIWFLGDPIAPEETRYFEIKATGASIDMENHVHIATIQRNGGNTIDHVFEKINQ